MKRRQDIIPLTACLLICALLLLLLLPEKSDIVIEGGPDRSSEGFAALPSEAVSSEAVSSAVSSEPPPPPYVSPVDFNSLWARCPDIYSWLQIPGTNIDYPVVRKPGDDDYYLRRDIDGKYATAGSLYSQASYNAGDYSDPVTVIYGHHMRSGEMFGHLQEYYADADSFAALREVIVYLPDKELHYSVFAAVPYSTTHILWKYHNFRTTIPATSGSSGDTTIPSESDMQAFLQELRDIRGFSKNLSEDILNSITANDRLLVLSTCLQGNNKQRYIVIARLDYSIP